MPDSEMEELLVFPAEIPHQQALFERSPLWIAKIFLECFDSTGRQARRVPRHVLEALARRFLAVMDGDAKSLDAAFGGRVRWQRNNFEASRRQYRVAWEMRAAMEQLRKQSPAERGAGTPFEIAVERVAKKMRTSAENVRRLYKASGAG